MPLTAPVSYALKIKLRIDCSSLKGVLFSSDSETVSYRLHAIHPEKINLNIGMRTHCLCTLDFVNNMVIREVHHQSVLDPMYRTVLNELGGTFFNAIHYRATLHKSKQPTSIFF